MRRSERIGRTTSQRGLRTWIDNLDNNYNNYNNYKHTDAHNHRYDNNCADNYSCTNNYSCSYDDSYNHTGRTDDLFCNSSASFTLCRVLCTCC